MAVTTDDNTLEVIRERRLYAKGEWADIQDEAEKDMLYVSGQPWPTADKSQREETKRPIIVVDEFGQYVNQVINDLRMNKRGIMVTARGNGANDVTSRFIQGKIRDVEYNSNAQQAYTTMAADAIQRSYGYLKVTSQRTGTGWDKEPCIEPVVNPDRILPDPDFLRSDGSDWKWLFEDSVRDVKEFAREFPHAQKQSFSMEDVAVPGGWYDGKKLILTSYWSKEKTSTKRKRLLRGKDGADPYEADAVTGDEATIDSNDILDQRDVDQFTVTQELTNGFEILRKTPWPGQSIPYVGCYGKILYIKGKRIILSMVRLARDPAMLLNYIRSAQMELVGMTPKFPYFFWEGSLSPESLGLIAKSLHEPVAGIPVRPLSPNGQPTQGFPERNPYDAGAVQALEVLAEAMRRSIQSSMGTGFLPTQAQRQNEKSGKALDRINSSAQKGAFHFTDHYDDAVKRTGQILSEVIPSYFDTARDTAVRTPTDDARTVRINDPGPQPPAPIAMAPGMAPQAPPPMAPHADMNQKAGFPVNIPVLADAVHDVTISVGPAEDSQRDSVNDLVQSLVNNGGFMQELGPQKGQKVLAQSLKILNVGPQVDAIADIIDPPQTDGPNPQQLQQQLQQAGQEIQKAHAAIGTLSQEIATKKADLDSKERIAAADRAEQASTADKDRAARIEVARIGAKTQHATTLIEAKEEQIALGAQLASDALESDKARAHDIGMAHVGAAVSADQSAQAHAQGLEAGDVQHQQAMESGDQGQAHALEQQEQAATLAPGPEGPQ